MSCMCGPFQQKVIIQPINERTSCLYFKHLLVCIFIINKEIGNKTDFLRKLNFKF